MKKEKLKNYNQWVLAIIGTLCALAILLLILAGIEYKITRWKRDRNYEVTKNNDLFIELPSDTTNKKLKLQELTFSLPSLLDSANHLYIIPVSQVNLEAPEYVDDAEYEIAPMTIQRNKNFKIRYFKRRFGEYNNLIIYNGLTRQMTPIFDYKIVVTSHQLYAYDNIFYLFITGSTVDSNGDNILNDKDLETFYIYNINDKKLVSIKIENHGLVDYAIVNSEYEIVLKYCIDKNRDGVLNRNTEPTILKLHNIKTSKTSNFISADLTNKLQKIIESN